MVPIPVRLSLAALVVLSACTQHETPAEGPVPPADAPAEAPMPAVDWMRDLKAVGTEPFWALEIGKGRMTLSGPDRETVAAEYGAVAPEGAGAVFEGRSVSGGRLKVTLTPQPCSDGMSDLTYPYAAEVQTAGETLKGCAAPTDAWPRQPDAA